MVAPGDVIHSLATPLSTGAAAHVLIGSGAVADIVLAHWVTDLSMRLATSRPRAGSCGGRRAMTHTPDDSSRDIPKGGPRAVGFASQQPE